MNLCRKLDFAPIDTNFNFVSLLSAELSAQTVVTTGRGRGQYSNSSGSQYLKNLRKNHTTTTTTVKKKTILVRKVVQ